MARLSVSAHGVTKVSVTVKRYKNYVSHDVTIHYNDYDGSERTSEWTLYSDDGVLEIPFTFAEEQR